MFKCMNLWRTFLIQTTVGGIREDLFIRREAGSGQIIRDGPSVAKLWSYKDLSPSFLKAKGLRVQSSRKSTICTTLRGCKRKAADPSPRYPALAETDRRPPVPCSFKF